MQFLPSLLLATTAIAPALSQERETVGIADAATRAAIQALGSEVEDERAAARTALEEGGPRTLYALVRHRRDTNPLRRRAIEELLPGALELRIPSIHLEGVTLGEACRALEEASGFPISAVREDARSICYSAENVPFWEAVLEICRLGDTGIVPPVSGGSPAIGTPIRLDPDLDPPTGAYSAGPVLVELRAEDADAKRHGRVEVFFRTIPGLALLGATEPEFSKGKDFEG